MVASKKYNLIVILGPTASGKTSLATQLAYELEGEIISADSRQVYRQMDLGTGKDLEDYVVNGVQIPYHLIDIVDAGEKYNVYQYQNHFFEAFTKIQAKGKIPIMCGGTGMYIEAVLKHFNLVQVPPNAALREFLAEKTLVELTEILKSYKNLHNNSDVDTKKRAIRAIEIEDYYKSNPTIEVQLPELNPLVIGVDIDRDLRREKITHRLQQRLDMGMVDEVRRIIESGVSAEDLIYYGLEYKYLTLYAIGELSYEDMFSRLNIAIHQFAKRQMTYFRKMEKAGIEIHWMNANEPVAERVKKIKAMGI